jgi:hypothetical protein
MKHLFTLVYLLTFSYLNAQVGINDQNTQPQVVSILDIHSSSKGVLFPRMAKTQILNISSPATGLAAFDLTMNNLNIFNGTNWTNELFWFEKPTGMISRTANSDTLFAITETGSLTLGKKDGLYSNFTAFNIIYDSLLAINDYNSSINTSWHISANTNLNVDTTSIVCSIQLSDNQYAGNLNNKKFQLTNANNYVANYGNASHVNALHINIINDSTASAPTTHIIGSVDSIQVKQNSPIPLIVHRSNAATTYYNSHANMLSFLNDSIVIDNTSKVDTIILLKANVPTPSENNTEMKVWGLFFRNDMYNALCGNLGVGANTSTPSQKLEINGNMLLRNGGATHNHIIIGENGKPNRAAVVQNGLYYNNTLMYQGIFSHNAMLTSGNDATFEKINPTNKALFIEMNGSEYNMTFCSLGGQSAPFVRGSLVRFSGNGLVGIGTENPQATLHISSLLKLEPTLIPPLPHTEGMIYYDNTTNKLKVYTGSIWEEIN